MQIHQHKIEAKVFLKLCTVKINCEKVCFERVKRNHLTCLIHRIRFFNGRESGSDFFAQSSEPPTHPYIAGNAAGTEQRDGGRRHGEHV